MDTEERPCYRALTKSRRLKLFDGMRKYLFLSFRLFRFGENDIDYVKGMDDDDGYETERWTVDRFFEIAVRYFKDKLPPGCTWQTLKDALIACTMHEG